MGSGMDRPTNRTLQHCRKADVSALLRRSNQVDIGECNRCAILTAVGECSWGSPAWMSIPRLPRRAGRRTGMAVHRVIACKVDLRPHARSDRATTFRRTSRLTGRRHVFLPHPAVAWTSRRARATTPRYRCPFPLPKPVHIGAPDLRFCDTSAHLIKAAQLLVTDRQCALHGPSGQRPLAASAVTVRPSHRCVQDMRVGTSRPNAHNGSVP